MCVCCVREDKNRASFGIEDAVLNVIRQGCCGGAGASVSQGELSPQPPKQAQLWNMFCFVCGNLGLPNGHQTNIGKQK